MTLGLRPKGVPDQREWGAATNATEKPRSAKATANGSARSRSLLGPGRRTPVNPDNAPPAVSGQAAQSILSVTPERSATTPASMSTHPGCRGITLILSHHMRLILLEFVLDLDGQSILRQNRAPAVDRATPLRAPENTPRQPPRQQRLSTLIPGPSGVFFNSPLLIGRSGASAPLASRTLPEASCAEIWVSLTFCARVVYTVCARSRSRVRLACSVLVSWLCPGRALISIGSASACALTSACLDATAAETKSRISYVRRLGAARPARKVYSA